MTESRSEDATGPDERARGRTLWIAVALAAITAGVLTLLMFNRARHPEESRATAAAPSMAPSESAAPTAPASVASAPVQPVAPSSASGAPKEERARPRPVARPTASTPAASASSRTTPPNGAPILY